MTEKGTAPDAVAWAASKKFRPAYARPLSAYRELGCERALKKWVSRARTNWIAAGCPAGGPDFPPLDHPEKLVAWRLAHTDYRPAAKFYDLAAAGTSADSAVAARAVGAPPQVTDVSSDVQHSTIRTPRDIADVRPTDLADAVAYQARCVTLARDALDAARARIAPAATAAELNTLQKTYDATVAALRDNQRALDAALAARGDRPLLEDVRAEIEPIVSAMAASFVALLTDRGGVARDRAIALRDEWFHDLTATRFVPALPIADKLPAA